MKEAIITDINGLFKDVELVTSDTTGVIPIYEALERSEMGVAIEPQLIGYKIAVKCPEGLYSPRFNVELWCVGDYDSAEELWVEGLSPEELAKRLEPQPVPKTAEQLEIERLTKENAAIKNDNLMTMEAVAEIYEMLVAGQGGTAS